MPERITDAELAKLKELEAKATEPPWRWGEGRSTVLSEDGILAPDGESVSVHCGRGSGDISTEDAALVIASRNHLPALIAEIEAKRETTTMTYTPDDIIGVCGKCREDTSGPKFCGHCGKEILWK